MLDRLFHKVLALTPDRSTVIGMLGDLLTGSRETFAVNLIPEALSTNPTLNRHDAVALRSRVRGASYTVLFNEKGVITDCALQYLIPREQLTSDEHQYEMRHQIALNKAISERGRRTSPLMEAYDRRLKERMSPLTRAIVHPEDLVHPDHVNDVLKGLGQLLDSGKPTPEGKSMLLGLVAKLSAGLGVGLIGDNDFDGVELVQLPEGIDLNRHPYLNPSTTTPYKVIKLNED